MAHVFSSSLAVNGNRVCKASSSLSHSYPPCTLTFVVAVSWTECAVQHLLVEEGTYLSLAIIYILFKSVPPFMDANLVKHEHTQRIHQPPRPLWMQSSTT